MFDSPVIYFEPNNIEYNMEDLCIAVRLEICYMNRELCKQQTLVGEIKKNKADFYEGDDGFLTTSYTNITLMDMINGGNKESIGIENITIKYNSWYFPEVSIKFVDIRGNSLFNPMELTNDSAYKEVANGSFFKGFFTFPYPIFKMTIKGYFGLPVTFNLTIKDIPRATLNSNTGNFELSVNFIGHLYSYLTDIPMTLLIVSPYIQHHGVEVELGKFSNGVTIPTIPEFIKKTGEITSQFNGDEIITTKLNEIEKIDNNLNFLKEIISELRNIETIINRYFKEINRDSDKITFLFITDQLQTVSNKYNTYSDVLIDLKNSINSCGKYKNKIKDIVFNLIITRNVVEKIDNNPDNTISIYYNIDRDVSIVNRIMENQFKTSQNLSREIKNKKNETFDNVYGWRPTLKNIIELLLAHLLKFNKNMESSLLSILSQSADRDIRNLSCETDVPNGKAITSYPFLRFFNNQKEILWIGDTEAKNYDERVFVENILFASQKMTNDIDYSVYLNQTMEQLSKLLLINGVPSIWYDVGNDNPYIKTLKDCGDSENMCKPQEGGKLPIVFETLAKRMVDSYLLNGSSGYTTTIFPEVEAINLLSALFNPEMFATKSIWNSENTNIISQFEEHVRTVINGYEEEFKINRLNNTTETLNSEYNLEGLTMMANKKRKVFISESLRGINFNESYGIEQYYFKRVDSSYDNTIEGSSDGSVFRTNEHEFYVKVPTKLLGIETEEEYNSIIEKARGVLIENSINDGAYGNVFHYISEATETKTLGDMYKDESTSFNMGSILMKDGDKVKDDFFTIENGDHLLVDIDLWIDDVVDFASGYAMVKNGGGIASFSYFYSFVEPEYAIEDFHEANMFITDILRALNFKITLYDLCGFNNGGVIKIPMISFLGLGNAITSGVLKVSSASEEMSNVGENGISDWFMGTYFAQQIQAKYKDVAVKQSIKLLNAIRSLKNEEKSRDYTFYGKTYTAFYCELDKSALYDIKNFLTDSVYLFMPYRLENGELKFSTSIINERGFNVDSALDDNILAVSADCVDTFLFKIREYIFKPNEETTSIGDVDRKIAIYDLLKTLYDKWKFGAEKINPQEINHRLVGIDDFVFRNALNQDISDLNVNVEKVINLLLSIYKGETSMSLYNFLFEICSYADCLLLSLPLNVFDATSSNTKLMNMFTPYPFTTTNSNNVQGQTFIVTYRQKDSQHLNFGSNGDYKDDGIDFTNKHTISSISSGSTFGAFGVTYGLNKQSLFKNIQVSMDKPIVTEQSIASTLYIAEQGGKGGSNKIGYTYHDVFDTYSNHSYQCSVEMMGNVQIMPMMYFQLNNVPLFKGGYFITSVEHDINNRGMTTKFTGNRINIEQFILSQSSILNLDSKEEVMSDFPSVAAEGNKGKTNSKTVNTALTYTKSNTIFVINAGRIMTDEGFESPDLIKDGFMDINYIKGERQNGETDDILQPYDINGETTNRYREYWGNRKLATELVYELKKNKYKATYGGDNTKDSINRIKKYFQNDTKFGDNNIIIINLYTDSSSMEDVWLETNNFSFYASPDAISIKLSRMLFNTISIELRHTEIGDMTCNAFTVEKTEINNIDGFNNVIAPSVVGMNLNMQNKRHIKFLSKKENRQKIINGYIKGIEKFINAIEGKPIEISVPQKDSMMSKYFSYEDLTRTNKKIPNIPNEAEKQNLITLATTILDKVREKYGPIWVDSAFRSPEVNAAVGGVSNSQHLTGSAADIYAMDRVNNGPLFWAAYDLMQSGEITVGQLIWEYGNTTNPRWVHISLPNGSKINEVIRYYRNDDGKKCNKPFDIPHP